MKQLHRAVITGTFLCLLPAFGQSPAVLSDRAAARLLDQATFGPTPAAIAELQQMGIANWLNLQFALYTSDIPDQPIVGADGKINRDLSPVQAVFFQNAVTGSDQLRQRIALALSEIWVVSAVSTNYAYAYPPYWRIFRDNAFGNYRDLMKAVSLSPAMGNYLNMVNNAKGNPAKGTAANENYARELMQLFTVGLNRLNMDGTPLLDANGAPEPIYTQAIVTDTARALTGWTYPTVPLQTAKPTNPAYFFGWMEPVETRHDTTAKTIIGGVKLPPGQTAEQDLDAVLDALMARPTMAPFISRQLIQHLVTSDPSPAYVRRVAIVFADNGAGVRGDLKAVITAILTDPEARAGDDPSTAENSDFGHLREPVLFLTNLLRGLNATIGTDNGINNKASLLGQNLFRAPSVFSYFSPQYRLESGQPAPEFQIYTTQTAASRNDVITSAIYGKLDSTTTLDLSRFVQAASTTSGLLDAISYTFLHHSMSSALQQAAAGAADAAGTPKGRAQAALYVVLSSSEYQVIQ